MASPLYKERPSLARAPLFESRRARKLEALPPRDLARALPLLAAFQRSHRRSFMTKVVSEHGTPGDAGGRRLGGGFISAGAIGTLLVIALVAAGIALINMFPPAGLALPFFF